MTKTMLLSLLQLLLLTSQQSLAFHVCSSNKMVSNRHTSSKDSPFYTPSFALKMSESTDDDNISDDINAIEDIKKRSSLKLDLLAMAASYDRGFGASPKARNRVDTIIRELEAYNPEEFAAMGINGGNGDYDMDNSQSSPLEGSWRMIWTTASDVLVLGASPVATVGAIYQLFDDLPVVTNVIDFIPKLQSLLPPNLVPASLIRAKVQTRASAREGFPNRVGLSFEAVKLQPVEFLGQDATSLPPFAANLPKLPGTDNNDGPGYFDVTYLDDELLVIQQGAPGGLFALVKVTDSDP